RKAGLQIKKYRDIKNSWFEFISHRRQHLFVNSQGSVILQQLAIYELRFHVWVLTADGEGLSQEVNLIEGDLDDLPNEKEFLKILHARIEALLAVRTAPRINSYSGPVLLSPDACGLFFHEVVGHRLEGSRLLSPDEGATFMDLRGKRIAPDFIDIIDDPTVATYADGRRMIGAFPYDDEGAASRRAVLVEKGVLKNFLTTSAPIPGQRKLNGHARNNLHERPISRMGNLFVINRKPISREEIRARFIEEIKKQKKPFGIMVKAVLGGETGTGSYDFQAFKGEVLSAVRVFPDGREEPVRGVDFVGTPLSALDSVICLGDDQVMDNSYCGAESGMVPVSTVAPSMLIRNLELQSQDRERFTQYALPLPYK
ncbi:MAG: metallopeptidase TldD-related protein, partial [Leptospirales bacterium]